MSRRPQDPSDPFNFDDHNSSPFGGFDPFNDPFFKQFEEIHNHMFREFFGEHDRPSIFIQHPHSDPPNNTNTPDLSQINPNAPSTHQNNDINNQHSTAPSFFRMFKHFFEPEYDDHTLSDINPNLSHGPIMDNDNDNKGLIHPDNTPPGFRSPYLPHSNGAEKRMEFGNNNNGQPQSFYRSQSVIISTGADGKTTRTTTIRDSNGEVSTNTEEFDGNNGGGGVGNIFNFGFGGRNDEYCGDEKGMNVYGKDKRRYKLFEQTHDPFEKFRSKWQNWKWNPYNWYGNDSGNDSENYNGSDSGGYDVFGGRRNDGIKWRSYKEYKGDNKGPSLLDDIVKKDDK